LFEALGFARVPATRPLGFLLDDVVAVFAASFFCILPRALSNSYSNSLHSILPGIFDYCGLVNGRNSYGGYVGFQKFYAQISKNDKGQFTKGLIRTIASDDVGTIATDGLCEKHGYADLSQAR
jgi:hypothetical protein